MSWSALTCIVWVGSSGALNHPLSFPSCIMSARWSRRSLETCIACTVLRHSAIGKIFEPAARHRKSHRHNTHRIERTAQLQTHSRAERKPGNRIRQRRIPRPQKGQSRAPEENGSHLDLVLFITGRAHLMKVGPFSLIFFSLGNKSGKAYPAVWERSRHRRLRSRQLRFHRARHVGG